MLPKIRAIQEVNVDDKRKSCESLFESVISDILITYDWPFAIKESTEDSVADQASYQLRGDDDCRQVINIRFGDDEILLDKRRLVDMDEYSDGRTFSSELFWVEDGFFDGFPKVKIIDTPDASGDAILYRYRAKNIELSSFPDQFEKAFIYGIASAIEPQFLPLFNKSLDRLIDNYSYGGGEDDVMKQDPLVVYRNNRRSEKFGYGG